MNRSNSDLYNLILSKNPDLYRAKKLIGEEINNLEIIYHYFDDLNYGVYTTYLQIAIDNIQVDIVRMLLEAGANPNYFNEEYRLLPPLYDLSICSEKTAEMNINKLIIAKMLIDCGADIDLLVYKENKTIYELIKRNYESDVDPDSDYMYRYNRLLFDMVNLKKNNELDESFINEIIDDLKDD